MNILGQGVTTTVDHNTGSIEIDKIQSFSAKEILAIEYAKLISQTPVDITAEFNKLS